MTGNDEHNESNESNKSNESNEIKRIRLHFMYVSIILSLLILILVSCIFYGIEVSWQFLSFAGVALSLVLSVIAILITLIDVAGQKKQVHEIFKSSEELQKVIKQQKKLILKHVENIDNVDDMLNNTFEKYLTGKKVISTDRDELTTSIDVEKEETDSSSLTNHYTSDLFTTTYKTFTINKPLTEKQEDEINIIMREFKLIKVKFYDNQVSLNMNTLYTSPLVDRNYIKKRASVSVERYLRKEGLLSST